MTKPRAVRDAERRVVEAALAWHKMTVGYVHEEIAARRSLGRAVLAFIRTEQRSTSRKGK